MVYLVCSVCLVYLVEPDQLNELNKPDRPNEPNRPRTSEVWRRRAGSNRCIAVLQHVRADDDRRRPRAADYYATLMNSRTSPGRVVKETDWHRLVIVPKTVTEP